MSVNIYLTEVVRNAEGFKSVPHEDGSGDKMTIHGMNVFRQHGRLYVMHGDRDPISEVLKEFVDEISYHEWIPRVAPRESGIYKCGSAEGELIPDNAGGKEPKYRMSFRAKTMEDIWELVRLIKIGGIRPIQSYEGPQGSKSAKELAEEVVRLENENSRLKERLVDLDKLSEINLNLQRLHAMLLITRRPLCQRTKVLTAISDVLYPRDK